MLAPVANHQATSHDRERKNEHEQCRAGVDVVVEEVDGRVIAKFPECHPAGVFRLAFSPEVQRKLQPDQEDESTHVASKVEHIVPVVEHGRAEVVLTIALDMVMLDVVVKVGVPCMSVHGIQQVWEKRVEKPILGSQDSVPVDVLMLHQGEGAAIVQLHEPMQNAV